MTQRKENVVKAPSGTTILSALNLGGTTMPVTGSFRYPSVVGQDDKAFLLTVIESVLHILDEDLIIAEEVPSRY